MTMGRQEINQVHLDAMRDVMKKNNSRFIICLALEDDGKVDAMLNVHDSDHMELMATITRFIKEYYEALKQHNKE